MTASAVPSAAPDPHGGPDMSIVLRSHRIAVAGGVTALDRPDDTLGLACGITGADPDAWAASVADAQLMVRQAIDNAEKGHDPADIRWNLWVVPIELRLAEGVEVPPGDWTYTDAGWLQDHDGADGNPPGKRSVVVLRDRFGERCELAHAGPPPDAVPTPGCEVTVHELTST